MKSLIPVFVAFLLPPVLSAGELPQLQEKEWVGNYAGYERRSFEFRISGRGDGLLLPMGDKGKLASDRIGIKVLPLIEEVMPDGKIVAKMPTADGWEAVTPATVNPEKLVFRGTAAGEARFEVTFEFDGDEIRAGGKVLEKGKLTNPLRFVLRFQFPDAYPYDTDPAKRAVKAKKDRVDLLRTDGKKLKLDLLTPLDAEAEKFGGPGVSQARVEIDAYKGHRFDFNAGPNASFEFWNKGDPALVEGFTLGWKPDPAKDPDGKSRVVFEVR